MERSYTCKPHVSFEVEKVIGVSGDGSYQVQWAPAWVSRFHLVGCEHLIQEFLQRQCEKEIGAEVELDRPCGESELQNSFLQHPTVDMNDNRKMPVLDHVQEHLSLLPQGVKVEESIDDMSNNQEEIISELSSDGGEIFQVEYNEESIDSGLLHQPAHVGGSEVLHRENECSDNSFHETTDLDSRNDNTPRDSTHCGDKSEVQDYDGKVSASSAKDESTTIASNCDLVDEVENRTLLASMLGKIEDDDDEIVEILNISHISKSCYYSSELTDNELAVSAVPCQGKDRIDLPESNEPFHENISGDVTSDSHVSSVCKEQFPDNQDDLLQLHTKTYQPNLGAHSITYDHQTNAVDHKKKGKVSVCEYCGKGFPCVRGLRNHIRHHTGEKPFPCPVCGKAFSESGNLKKHLRVHTGERPFQCFHCGKSFSHKHHLERHILTHGKDK